MTKGRENDHNGERRCKADSQAPEQQVGEGGYTGFGERVTGTPHRYGYAGAWGYQTDETGNLPFLQVGARYYHPAAGRRFKELVATPPRNLAASMMQVVRRVRKKLLVADDA